MTAESAPQNALPKKFTLRLDDGTIIKRDGEQPVVLAPAEAWKAGHLTEDHLIKAQALLCEMHAKLPDEIEGLKSMSTGTKRSMDSVLEMNQVVSAKRPRSAMSGGHHLANGNGNYAPAPPPAIAPVAAAPPPPAPVAAPPAAPPANQEFVRGCKALVQYLIDKVLGPANAPIFRDPVDGRTVPDYYNIIRKPICLRDILHKLDSAQYSSPADFYLDMNQLFENCFTYNVFDSPVGQMGHRLETAFDAAWAKLPFASSAPPKPPRNYRYAYEQPAKRGGFGAGRGAGRAPAAGGFGGAPRGRGRVGRPPGVTRTKSVNSYQHLQPLPQDKAQELATAMTDEAVMEAKMNGVVEILQAANELPTNEDGEIELDISQLSAPVMWKLYEFVIGGTVPGKVAQPGFGNGVPGAGGFQIDGEDSDYAPEEDDDE